VTALSVLISHYYGITSLFEKYTCYAASLRIFAITSLVYVFKPHFVARDTAFSAILSISALSMFTSFKRIVHLFMKVFFKGGNCVFGVSFIKLIYNPITSDSFSLSFFRYSSTSIILNGSLFFIILSL